MFTKKHYKIVAEAIAKSQTQGHIYLIRLIDNFCVLFGEDNPKFDDAKFRHACYGEGLDEQD